MSIDVSVVLPAKNEGENLSKLLPRLKAVVPMAEIIVVDDGSSDDTVNICKENNVKFISHVYSKGNGAAVKSGARSAVGDVIVFMDGDGQHDPRDIPRLLETLESGYDMVVGARDSASQATAARGIANSFYNKFSSWMVGQKVEDLTSGFRAVRKEKFLEFLYLLPNGFSYPTTSTMAFFRAGYSVGYIPIKADKREGKSHINIWRDGVRFLLIIFKVGTLYSPLKIFFPISLLQLFLGLGYYAYTFVEYHRFTNMSALLFTSSLLVFLMGLVSEQITSLQYKDD